MIVSGYIQETWPLLLRLVSPVEPFGTNNGYEFPSALCPLLFALSPTLIIFAPNQKHSCIMQLLTLLKFALPVEVVIILGVIALLFIPAMGTLFFILRQAKKGDK